MTQVSEGLEIKAIPLPDRDRVIRFDVEGYHRMVETGYLRPDARVELIEGEIVFMSPMNAPHISGLNALLELLSNTGKKYTLQIQVPVLLSKHTEIQPNASLLKYRADRYEDPVPTGDDALLFIEVSDSTLAFDRNVKLSLYATYSIPEYWIVNKVDKTVEIYARPEGGAYTTQRIAQRGETISPQLLPSVRLTVADIFS